jgi:hypothetical protein
MSLVLALRLPPTPGRGLPSCQAMIVAGRHTCVRPTVMSGAGICSRTRYVLIVATFTPRYAATSDVVHHSIAGSGRSLTLPLSPTTPPRGHLLPVVPQSRACRIPGCRGAGERERRQGRREGVACPRGIDGHRAAGEVTAARTGGARDAPRPAGRHHHGRHIQPVAQGRKPDHPRRTDGSPPGSREPATRRQSGQRLPAR